MTANVFETPPPFHFTATQRCLVKALISQALLACRRLCSHLTSVPLDTFLTRIQQHDSQPLDYGKRMTHDKKVF